MYGSPVDRKTNGGECMISDLLPKLPAEAVQDSEREELQEWAIGMLQFYPPGGIHDMPDWGITLQIESTTSARCIRVVDHEWCLFRLQQIITTFNAAGLELKVDQITMLQPFIEGIEEGETAEQVLQSSDSPMIEVV